MELQGNTSPQLFAFPPAIGADGTLTFTPRPNVRGTADITIQLQDDGGTADGGLDTSAPQKFQITITKPHPWHNVLLPLDVTGDGHIAPNDALEVINYINAFRAGPVPSSASIGPAFYDTANSFGQPLGDNFVTATDVLAIINHINAARATAAGEGESAAAEFHSPSNGVFETDDRWDELVTLLAMDLANERRRR
jgi:hypothetical protein